MIEVIKSNLNVLISIVVLIMFLGWLTALGIGAYRLIKRDNLKVEYGNQSGFTFKGVTVFILFTLITALGITYVFFIK